MSELQAKFLIGTMAFLFFLGYFIPKYREMEKMHEQVVKSVGQYAPPETTTTPAK